MDKNIEKLCRQTLIDLREAEDNEFNLQLDEIRQQGVVELIPFLVEYATDPKIETERRHRVLQILTDLTSESSKPYLLEAVERLKGSPERAVLLATLWQSRLSFADSIEHFLPILFEEDYYSAIEVASLVEGAFHQLETERREAIKQSLREHVTETHDKSQQFYLTDLLHSLENDVQEG